MKKIWSFIIVFALIFNFSAAATLNIFADTDETKISNQLLELSDSEIEATLSTGEAHITVLITFNYPDIERNTLEDLPRSERNASIKAYYCEKNLAIASSLNIPHTSISSYSRYAEFIYLTLQDFRSEEDFIYNLANSSDVSNVEISITVNRNYSEITPDTRADTIDLIIYPYSQALQDIGYVENSYTGEGIRVGIMEYSRLGNTSLADADKVHQPDGITGSTDVDNVYHTDNCVYLIGGYNGIASDVSFYIYPYTPGALLQPIEWFLDNNVDIINICVGPISPAGYTTIAEYFDHIIDTTGCSIISAAGNSGDYLADDDPEDPKTYENNDVYSYFTMISNSANCITVGASDVNKNVPFYSSFYTPTTQLLKPDLVAPGGKFSFLVQGREYWGTSLSTPIVTGISARLMDEFPTLQTKPYLLKAVLLASCVPLPNQTDDYDYYAGAGLVNYSRARTIMQQGTYGYFYKNPDTMSGEYIGGFELFKPANTSINIHFTQQIPGAYSTLQTIYYRTPLFSSFEFMVSNGSQWIRTVNTTTTGSFSFPSLSYQLLQSFTIEIYMDEDKSPDYGEYLAYAYTYDPTETSQ